MTTTDLSVPTHFRCPISLELMKDPVAAPTGITYDRWSIEKWLGMGNTDCPVTGRPIAGNQQDLVPNHVVREMIQDWCVARSSLGVPPIPTPRVPVTRCEAVEILSGVDAASVTGDRVRCRRMAAMVYRLARESERNRACLRSSGAGLVLSRCFESLSRDAAGSADIEVLEEILSSLVAVAAFPMDPGVCSRMGTSESVRSLVWILKQGRLEGRVDAVRTVRELLRQGKTHSFPPEPGALADALVKLLKQPISSQATKSGLVSVFHLLSPGDAAALTSVLDLGMIDVVVELLVDCDKSTSEKCLGVLDRICDHDPGREAARGHELTLAVLAKKLLNVSNLATEFAVSVLWKLLCKGTNGGGSNDKRWRCCIEEALQVGSFQKLLLLLQIGCGVETKEKASELLRTLNSDKGKLECIQTADFKGLKRPV